MLFKTSIITLAVIAASVSAQTFEKTPCSDCILGTMATDSVCAALTPADAQTLMASVSGGVNVTALMEAVKIPAIRDCACHWSTDAFSATGSAAACAVAQGTAAAACTAAEITEATTKITPLQAVLNCQPATNTTATSSAGTPTATSNSSTPTATSGSSAPTTTGATGTKPSGTTGSAASVGFSLNLRYVASVVVLGAAAFAF
ncbi:hypothetical protein BGZ76_001537 [Entomortierella beljakovae]|nr:hypothetical protein BGZ76_001537 [Entomortierella beljakovae]